ncbi:MAG TPA: ABC transporter permease [Candidatus Acidoferrum sp.]|nr:ABC transporter permease [Candidatus Acidoferrum sp.]
MEKLWQDIRYAFRVIARNPGFTAAAVLTLALGIGANTAIFSIVNAVLLRPLPYPRSEQIVSVFTAQPNFGNTPMSYPEFAAWRDKSQIFQTVAASANRPYTITNLSIPEQVRGLRVSTNYLELFGARFALGRNFRPEEEPLAAARVAIVTNSFWRTHLGGDRSALDRKLVLDDNVYSIVGVLAPDFQPIAPVDILTPFRFTDATIHNMGLHFLSVGGRLRDGLTVAEARRQLNSVIAQVKKDSSTDNGITIEGLKDNLTQGTGTPLALMFGAVGFVLLIGCANVANLLLARATGRHREMAVRIALGAGRGRLVRQLLTESTLLALMGGALGLALGRATLTGLLAVLGTRLPRTTEVTMNASVLLFALGIALLTGILFGLAPARSLLRTSLGASLGEGGRAGTGVGGRQRNMLVTCEVALALVLLVGAGLVLRSFERLLNVPKGFSADHVLTFNVDLPSVRYKTPAQQTEFFNEFRARLSALPGVETVGLVNELPLAGGNVNGDIDIEGRTFPKDSGPVADKRIASPGYFRAMRIPVLRGREFMDSDVLSAPHVAIINEHFARTYFPNEDPIAKHIAFNWDIDGFQEIVGVVGNVKHDSLANPDNSEVYVPYAQRPDSGFGFAVRTKSDPAAITSAVRATLTGLDAGIPLNRISTYDDIVSRSLTDQRANVFLLGSLGALALVLTAIGIYGVLAYTVAQQTRELGVRIALGASRSDVLSLVLGRGLRLVAIGAGIGLLASFALTRLMSALLYDIKPTDPVTFIGVTLVLFVVALAACWIPAHRATRVDPMVALRYE